eukprot:c16021_g1_i1.p1 GENE.c16021_g1_i1~~c16021_g1_i1.p1  ORF type:complete len:227 (-),score=46.28 c16021_g1_i1:30-710(-)
MVLKLYIHPVSQPARAVLWACLATNTPFEVVQILPGSKKPGGSRHEDFLKLNPAGTVPVIDDDGFILPESHAILKYLARKHKWVDLFPADEKTQATIDSYLHWHHRGTRELTIAFAAPLLRPDLKFPPEVVAANQKNTKQVFSAIENRLSKAQWIAGTPLPSIADLSAYCEIGQLTDEYLGLVDLRPYPHIADWINRCKQIPGHDAAHKVLKGFSAQIKAQKSSKL